MNSFNYTDDAATVARMSEQRDAIYDYVVDRFRHHMANDDIDSAMDLLMSSMSGWTPIN